MPRIQGKEEALKLLGALSQSEAKKLLEDMRSRDPEMAEFLESHLVSLEDLKYLSASQLMAFIRDLDLEELGIALKTVDKEVTDKILSLVSTGIKLDIEDGLKGPPRRLSEVTEAQDKILRILKDKIDGGSIVIDKEDKTV